MSRSLPGILLHTEIGKNPVSPTHNHREEDMEPKWSSTIEKSEREETELCRQQEELRLQQKQQQQERELELRLRQQQQREQELRLQKQ